MPRLAGTAAVAGAETAIAEQLTALGFTVHIEAFRTSDRRLRAPAVAGAAAGWLVLLLVPLLVLPFAAGWAVLVVGTAGAALVALLAVGIAQGTVPVGSVEVDARNLVATRGDPSIWLIAHSDSKAQRFSLLSRAIVSLIGVLGGVALLALLVWRVFGAVPWGAVAPVAVCVLIASAAFAMTAASPALDDSPGAVDNASGVIAALTAAHALGSRADVGVLITGAEELGMEGARAWCAGKSHPVMFVNFDGVDARGTTLVAAHRGASPELADALAGALNEAGVPARVGRLPFGVLVDGVALARAGHGGVTVMRGTLRTLAAVHTPRDTAARTDVAAAVAVGRAVAQGLAGFG